MATLRITTSCSGVGKSAVNAHLESMDICITSDDEVFQACMHNLSSPRVICLQGIIGVDAKIAVEIAVALLPYQLSDKDREEVTKVHVYGYNHVTAILEGKKMPPPITVELEPRIQGKQVKSMGHIYPLMGLIVDELQRVENNKEYIAALRDALKSLKALKRFW